MAKKKEREREMGMDKGPTNSWSWKLQHLRTTKNAQYVSSSRLVTANEKINKLDNTEVKPIQKEIHQEKKF